MKSRIKRVYAAIKSAWGPPAPKEKVEREYDPLDTLRPSKGNKSFNEPGFSLIGLPTVEDFPIYRHSFHGTVAMDGELVESAQDDGSGDPSITKKSAAANGYIPIQLQDWYMRQSFIGYQACALIAQHWLVDKACSMPGEDAVRNGWELKVTGDKSLSEEALNQIKEFDKKLNVKSEISQFIRFMNVFGIRVVLFLVESDDPLYYEKPFNPDGVTKDSYIGIRQIDPYWMMPMLTSASSSNPASEHFYDPEYWIISGRKYHRSHLVIGRGPQPADILKPMYIFGGIPMTQRIYERVYAAERTANEAPMLAMNKRTTAIHVDLKKVAANQDEFEERLALWVQYRDNNAVKVLGTGEQMEQFDTSLSDFDSIVMNQYQLVAAISKVPATKMLGTSPKGFNATGEFEENSYSQELESIQENYGTPFLDRHNLLVTRSLGFDVEVTVSWEPTDAQSKKALAELNKTKAETGTALINSGAIAPDEERSRVRNDKHSGYNNLVDEEAETEFGMSPENIAKLNKGESEVDKGQAALTQAGDPNSASMQPGEEANQDVLQSKPGNVVEADQEKPKTNNTESIKLLQQVGAALKGMLDSLRPDGEIFDGEEVMKKLSRIKPIKPAVKQSVHSIGNLVGQADEADLPKMNFKGLRIVVENPAGSTRRSETDSGVYMNHMENHYGYIKDTEGADGDEIDVFFGPNPESNNAFVIDQNIDGKFDEHKVMLGFLDIDSAEQAYRSAYSKDWEGIGNITPMTIEELKSWIDSGDTKSPLVTSR